MKCSAVYARTAQASPDSIQQQLERCSRAAERLGFRVDARFQDDGISGRCLPASRPGYRRLEDHLALGRCDLVIVDNADRLSRSGTHLAAVLEVFGGWGIRVLEAETECELSLVTLFGQGACALRLARLPSESRSRQ